MGKSVGAIYSEGMAKEEPSIMRLRKRAFSGIASLTVDKVVKMEVTAKVTGIERNEYDNKRLCASLEITKVSMDTDNDD